MTQNPLESDLGKNSKISFSSLSLSASQAYPLWGKLRRRLLGISPAEMTVTRRGFKTNSPHVQQQLETTGQTFLQGYNAVMGDDRLEFLIPRLNSIASAWRGFAYEGAAMGLTLLDYLTPWQRNRRWSFLAVAGDKYAGLVYVGMGLAMARIPGSEKSYLRQMESSKSPFPDRLTGWLALDGYGFHQGYFNWHHYVEGMTQSEKLSGYARRVFDQGLGRSLWFVCGADINLITQAIQNFPPIRQGDLWSGVGLACAYAGGLEKEAVQALRKAAGAYLPQLSQGAAFAAKARQQASNLATYTEMTCQILCGLSAEEAAEITDTSLANLPFDGEVPAYEIWRQRIQENLMTMEKN